MSSLLAAIFGCVINEVLVSGMMLRSVCLLALINLFAIGPSLADEISSSTTTAMRESDSITLNNAPVDVGFISESEFFLIEQGPLLTISTWRIDASGAMKIAEQDFVNAERPVAIGVAGQIFLAFKRNEEIVLLLLDRLLRTDASVFLETENPPIAVSSSAKRQILVTLDTRNEQTVLLEVEEQLGRLRVEPKRLSNLFSAVWRDTTVDLTFANGMQFPRLEAFNGSTSELLRAVGQISSAGSSRVGAPYVVDAKQISSECAGVDQMENAPFLIGDYSFGSVMAATYNEIFQVFDVDSVVTKLPAPRDGLRKQDFTNPLQLAADCMRRNVFVASSVSEELIQMSFNADYGILEVIGTEPLRNVPNAIAVSPEGSHALVSYPSIEVVAVYSRPSSSDPNQSGRASNLIRQVQRELAARGYSVGPVDGVLGPRTERAIEWYVLDSSSPLPSSDLQGILTELSSP